MKEKAKLNLETILKKNSLVLINDHNDELIEVSELIDKRKFFIEIFEDCLDEKMIMIYRINKKDKKRPFVVKLDFLEDLVKHYKKFGSIGGYDE